MYNILWSTRLPSTFQSTCDDDISLVPAVSKLLHPWQRSRGACICIFPLSYLVPTHLAPQMLTIICRCRTRMQILWLQFVPPQIVLLKTRLPISPGFQHSIYSAIDSRRKRANLTLAPNPPQQRRFIALLCRNVPDLLGCARLEQPQGHFALGLGTDPPGGPEDTAKQQLLFASPGIPPKPG